MNHQYELLKQCAIRLVSRMSKTTVQLQSSVTIDTGHGNETLSVVIKPLGFHFSVAYHYQVAHAFQVAPARLFISFVLNPESHFVESYTRGPAYTYFPDLEDWLGQL